MVSRMTTSDVCSHGDGSMGLVVRQIAADHLATRPASGALPLKRTSMMRHECGHCLHIRTDLARPGAPLALRRHVACDILELYSRPRGSLSTGPPDGSAR